jgi:hypothetical protein
MSRKESFSGSVTQTFVKQMALFLVGLIIISFSRSICKFSVSLLFKIVLYIMQSSAKSITVDSIFLQLLFTYARNSSGPSSIPYGTPDVTLTCSLL